MSLRDRAAAHPAAPLGRVGNLMAAIGRDPSGDHRNDRCHGATSWCRSGSQPTTMGSHSRRSRAVHIASYARSSTPQTEFGRATARRLTRSGRDVPPRTTSRGSMTSGVWPFARTGVPSPHNRRSTVAAGADDRLQHSSFLHFSLVRTAPAALVGHVRAAAQLRLVRERPVRAVRASSTIRHARA